MPAFTVSAKEILDRNSASRALLPAGLIALLEAVFAVVVAVVAATQLDLARWVGAGITLLVYGVAVGLASFGLWRHRGWARAVVICAQLLHLPVAWSFVQGAVPGMVGIGIVLGVVSIAVLVCVFWPSSIRVFANLNGPAGQH